MQLCSNGAGQVHARATAKNLNGPLATLGKEQDLLNVFVVHPRQHLESFNDRELEPSEGKKAMQEALRIQLPPSMASVATAKFSNNCVASLKLKI